MLLRNVPTMVPIIAIRTGDMPFGKRDASPNAMPAPNAEPISEYRIISNEEAFGVRTAQSVMANTEPSETPMMEGDAR